MKTCKIIRTVAIVFIMAIFICQTDAISGQERGAKSLFYDSNAAGTVQIGGNSFAPTTTGGGDGGGSGANPVSNYYDKLNPGLMYWVELSRVGSNDIKRVSNDRVFRSGDKIRIHVTTNSDGYLSVLNRGSSGREQIIPVSNSPNGEVRMGNDSVIPPNGGWLTFDNKPGQENIKLVFASIKSADSVLNSMKKVAANASSVPTQLVAVYEQYRYSRNNLAYVESGSKDLMMDGGGGGMPQPQMQMPQMQMPQMQNSMPMQTPVAMNAAFNMQGSSNFRVDDSIYNAPANYVVNTAQGSIKEPVIVEIVLNHHP